MAREPIFKTLAPAALLAVACILATLIPPLGPARAVRVSPDPELVQTFDALEPGLASAIAENLAADISDTYHVIKAADGGFRAANPAHGMEAEFTPAGLQVTGPAAAPDGTGTSVSGQFGWTWGLALTGWGYAGAIQPVPPADPVADDARLEYRRGRAITEWYLNTTWGLEQGFTIAGPPEPQSPIPNSQSSIILELTLTGSLRPRLNDDTTLLLSDAGGQTVARYAGLFAHDANGIPLPAHFSLPPEGEGEEKSAHPARRGERATLRIILDGTNAAYPITVDPWLQRAKLTAGDGVGGDLFGWSVAVSGDTVVVGAYGDGGYTGAAYVFVKPAGGWANATQTAKLTASDGQAPDAFGHSVAISGDTVVIGAPGDGDWIGSAYVFVRPGGGWANSTQTAKLTGSDGAADDGLGESVAISGDTVVVGAPGDGGWIGSAYVFVRPGGGWANSTQTAKLTGSDSVANDQFGDSVAISGDTVVVGAPGDGGDTGWAYVFVRPGGGWANSTQTAKLTASDGAGGDLFGKSVAVSGDTVVVGAPGDGGDTGSAYVFVRPGGGWANGSQTAKLTASDGAGGDGFGASVAVSGDTMVIGALGVVSYTGSAYVFVKPGGGWVNGTQTAKLSASDGAGNDAFGSSVAISGDAVVVGAMGDDSFRGSAYVFQEVSDIAVHKTAATATTGPGETISAEPGEAITYTLTFSNAGRIAVTNVVITDIIPISITTTSVVSSGVAIVDTGTTPGYVWSVQDLAAGESGVITVTGVLTSSLLPAQVVTNTASVAGVSNNSFRTNTASAVVAMHGADLALSKRVNDPLPDDGDTITYTLTVVNNGPEDTTGVAISDTLPVGVNYVSSSTTQGGYDPGTGVWAVGTLTTSNYAALTLIVQVNASPGTHITNTAFVSASDAADGITGNNATSVTIEVAHADLAVAKAGSPNPVVAGGRLTYTLTITNHGPADTTGVVLTDTLPGSVSFVSASPGCQAAGSHTVTCALEPLESQATATLVITVNTSLTRGPITNTANVAGDAPDVNSANDTATESTWVSAEADLALAKFAQPDPVLAGSLLTYTLTITNHGPDHAGGVVLTDALPSGTSFVSAIPSQGSCSEVGGAVTCPLGYVSSDAVATVTLRVNVSSTHTGTLTNTATVTGYVPDPLSSNNSVTRTTSVGEIDLALSKTANAGKLPKNILFEGGKVTYTVSLVNHGPVTATGVVVSDTLPEGIILGGYTVTLGTYTDMIGAWDVGTLAAGDVATLTITGTVDTDTIGQTITNTAVLSASTPADIITHNNTASVAVTVASPVYLPLVLRNQ